LFAGLRARDGYEVIRENGSMVSRDSFGGKLFSTIASFVSSDHRRLEYFELPIAGRHAKAIYGLIADFYLSLGYVRTRVDEIKPTTCMHFARGDEERQVGITRGRKILVSVRNIA